jgi:6-phosphogluconolactonase
LKPRKLIGAVVAVTVLGVMLACGGGSSSNGGGGGGGTAKALYVSNNASGNISGFTVDASSGALSPIAGSPFPETGSAPTWLAAGGSTVFFASSSPSGVGAAAIGSGNALANVALNTTGEIGGMTVTPDGSAVLIADRTSRTLGAYKASNGTLSAFGTPAVTDTTPAAVVITPNAKYVYVINASIFSTVTRFSYDASTGDLALLTGTDTSFPAAGGVGDIEASRAAIDRTGHYLIANSASGYLYVFLINADGSLTWSGENVPVSPYDALGGVAASPIANYVYTVDRVTNQVYGFSIGSNGFLSPLKGLPVATGAAPISVAIDPSGKVLYVVNQGDNSLSAYTIASDGSLTALSATTAVGSTPVDLVFAQ